MNHGWLAVYCSSIFFFIRLIVQEIFLIKYYIHEDATSYIYFNFSDVSMYNVIYKTNDKLNFRLNISSVNKLIIFHEIKSE